MKGLALEWSDLSLGERMLKRRVYLDLPQKEAAIRAGVTTSTYSLVESGVKTNPSLRLLRGVVKALDLTFGALLD